MGGARHGLTVCVKVKPSSSSSSSASRCVNDMVTSHPPEQQLGSSDCHPRKETRAVKRGGVRFWHFGERFDAR